MSDEKGDTGAVTEGPKVVVRGEWGGRGTIEHGTETRSG